MGGRVELRVRMSEDRPENLIFWGKLAVQELFCIKSTKGYRIR